MVPCLASGKGGVDDGECPPGGSPAEKGGAVSQYWERVLAEAEECERMEAGLRRELSYKRWRGDAVKEMQQQQLQGETRFVKKQEVRIHDMSEVLLRYRRIHSTDDADHTRALAKCGWTDDDFRSGKKKMFVEDDEANFPVTGV